eukprot:5757817-Pleurochrysis_carterae.AAC.8
MHKYTTAAIVAFSNSRALSCKSHQSCLASHLMSRGKGWKDCDEKMLTPAGPAVSPSRQRQEAHYARAARGASGDSALGERSWPPGKSINPCAACVQASVCTRRRTPRRHWPPSGGERGMSAEEHSSRSSRSRLESVCVGVGRRGERRGQAKRRPGAVALQVLGAVVLLQVDHVAVAATEPGAHAHLRNRHGREPSW